MRILDDDTDQPRDRITLYLKRAEAEDLRGRLDNLLDEGHHHEHVSSLDYRKEVTVCLYDEASLDGFDERSKTLIEHDK